MHQSPIVSTKYLALVSFPLIVAPVGAYLPGTVFLTCEATGADNAGEVHLA
jgi:hypothetical protein